ncbi:MAG: hypothetical protein DRG33_06410 [Deltaproteobacteria bacterium]|nr:MAG: hypothetical protein DRG33_06410 [Deltaproteobacteria bacterium]HEX16114.1 hypothetical protein [Deltaproteobacteria bacterium]
MRRWAALALMFLLFFYGGCKKEGPPKPVPIYPDEDVCETCRMLITDLRFAAEFIPKKGRAKKFDDPICMIRYFDMAKKLDLGITPEDVRAFYVKDFYTKEWVRAEEATFVKANIVTVMGYGVVAFKDRAQAEAFAKEHNGKLLKFADLWDMYKEANVVAKVVIKDGKMTPEVVEANFNDIVEIIAETEDERIYHITIKGYEDVATFAPIKKGHPRQVRFTADRPGEDFAFVDKDTGKILGKFWVKGGHFKEEEKKL